MLIPLKKVITYGIFDSIDCGHMDFLRRARALGDYLIVGLSTDGYLKRLGKGCLYGYAERKSCLESLSYVNEVIPEEGKWQKEDDQKKYGVSVLAAGQDKLGEYEYMEQFCQVVYLPRTPKREKPAPVSHTITLENVDHYGGELVYVLRFAALSGMYAMVRAVVDFMAYADALRAKPLILLPDFIYEENHPVNGTANPFEYYFEPVSDVKEADLDQSLIIRARGRDRNYIYSDGLDLSNFCTDFSYNETYFSDDSVYMDRAAKVLKKYIRFNPHTRKWLDDEISMLLKGKKTLGVHIRGADLRSHRYGHHPVFITTEDYVEAVRSVLKTHVFEQIFVATDDGDMLREFHRQFGDLVVHYPDVYRSTNGDHLYYAPVERENHKYRMGLEVIRDAETLVRCGGVILGMSQVGIHVKMRKMSCGERFEPLVLLYKGKNPD